MDESGKLGKAHRDENIASHPSPVSGDDGLGEKLDQTGETASVRCSTQIPAAAPALIWRNGQEDGGMAS